MHSPLLAQYPAAAAAAHAAVPAAAVAVPVAAEPSTPPSSLLVTIAGGPGPSSYGRHAPPPSPAAEVADAAADSSCTPVAVRSPQDAPAAALQPAAPDAMSPPAQALPSPPASVIPPAVELSQAEAGPESGLPESGLPPSPGDVDVARTPARRATLGGGAIRLHTPAARVPVSPSAPPPAPADGLQMLTALTPCRASKLQRQQLGAALVLTPARRSARLARLSGPAAGAEAMLEHCGWAYAPNPTLAASAASPSPPHSAAPSPVPEEVADCAAQVTASTEGQSLQPAGPGPAASSTPAPAAEPAPAAAAAEEAEAASPWAWITPRSGARTRSARRRALSDTLFEDLPPAEVAETVRTLAFTAPADSVVPHPASPPAVASEPAAIVPDAGIAAALTPMRRPSRVGSSVATPRRTPLSKFR